MQKNWTIYSCLDSSHYLCKACLMVPDQPGMLEAIANAFACHGVNITYFYYNRSEHPHRVLIEGKSAEPEALQKLEEELKRTGMFSLQTNSNLQLRIFNLQNLLKLNVYIEHRPGTLASFASLLRQRQANVIYMTYNEAVAENTATVTIVVQDTREIEELLKDLQLSGYYYSVEYKGADEKEAENIIGLNLVEYFYFKLKRLLGEENTDKLRKLVEASKRLSEALINFYREAGKDLAASKVFTNILTFAVTSRFKTGANFFYRRLPSLPLGNLTLHAFRLPTGGNIYLIESEKELVMIDGSYGIYYEDVKRMLKENGFNPAHIQRIYITHPDADHAGLSGYMAQEFGTQIFLHPDALEVLHRENRAWGSGSPLTELNHYFTVLVNTFTEFAPVPSCKVFNRKEKEKIYEFSVIDFFSVGGCSFKVLESLGGHVPGQVFFLSTEAGVVFTGDYLLFVPSLTSEEKEFLNLPKFMMTSTNTNSAVFRKEMSLLEKIAIELDEKLKTQNRGVILAPGHGDYYPARLLKNTN